MVAIPTTSTAIPTTPTAIRTPAGPVGFPVLILAAVVVGAGIAVISELDTRAGWLLAFLILLGVAFGYRDFGDQLVSIFGGSTTQ